MKIIETQMKGIDLLVIFDNGQSKLLCNKAIDRFYELLGYNPINKDWPGDEHFTYEALKLNKNMQINISVNNKENRGPVSMRQIANALNLSLDRDYPLNAFGFFNPSNKPDQIDFGACANRDQHNKLISLLNLYFSVKKNGYIALHGISSFIQIDEDSRQDFLDFVQKIGNIEDVKVNLDFLK